MTSLSTVDLCRADETVSSEADSMPLEVSLPLRTYRASQHWRAEKLEEDREDDTWHDPNPHTKQWHTLDFGGSGQRFGP